MLRNFTDVNKLLLPSTVENAINININSNSLNAI